MITIICLDKDDINTEPIGLHFNIVTKEGLKINFTPEALVELHKDITEYLKST